MASSIDPNRLQAAVDKLQMRLNSQIEGGDSDENIKRTQNNLDSLKLALNQHNQSQRQTDVNGRLTQDAPPSGGTPNRIGGDESGAFWFEPSVSDVQNRLRTDPSLSQRLNLTSWTSSPDQIESLDNQSTAYQSVADDMYRQAAEQAAQRGEGIRRYSKVQLTKNPFDYIKGGIEKIVPALAEGAGKAAFPYIGGKQRMQQGLDELNRDMGNAPQEPIEGTAGYRPYPALETAGEIAGSLSPSAPANLAARGVSNMLGYAGRGIIGKALTGAAAGAAAANTRGLTEDVSSGVANNQSVDDILKQAYEATPTRTIVGGALGGIGDLAGQGAGALVKGARANPRNADIKLLEEAGGSTHPIRGVKAPEEIQQNINKYVEGHTGETGQAEDIAAEKVVPQMRKSLEEQARNTHAKISQQMQEYFQSPEGLQEHSTRPAVEKMIDLMEQGSFKSPLKGETRAPDPGKVGLLRKELGNIAEVKAMNPEEAQAFADANDGIVMDANRASNVLGRKLAGGKSYVVVPSKMNAEAVTRMEDKIYEKLGFAKQAMGKDDPMWRGINEGFKNVRDQFDYADPAAKTALAPTELSSVGPGTEVQGGGESIPPAPIPQGTRREPTASEYARGDYGQGPKERFKDLEPEAQQALNEVQYNKNLSAQKREADRLAQLAKTEFAYADTPPAGTQVPTGKTENLSPDEIQDVPDSLTKQTNDLFNNPKQPSPRSGVNESDFWPGKYGEEYGPFTKSQNLNQAEWEGEVRALNEERQRQELWRRDQQEPTPSERVLQDIGEIGKYRSSFLERNPGFDPVNPDANDIISNDAYKKSSSLFPEVKNQQGVPDKAKLAQANQTVDVGKVKSIVDQTDQAASKLTPEELDAIHSYTSRKGEKVGTKEWESATKKLTVDNPTEGGPLYHGVRMPQEQIDKILKSKRFNIDKPTSASYNRGVSSAMAYSRSKRGEPVIFEIPEVDSGVSLASKKLGIAGTNNEKEILLNKKNFEVTGSHKDKEGNLVIQLKQKPAQLTATLDTGETVTGFSALRRKQHEAQQALEDATSLTGSNSNENATRRVQAFGRGPGQAERDAALLAEAKKLGLEKELRQVAGTGAYHRLAARAWGQAGNGMFNRIADFAGMRFDPLLRAAADYPPNPFAPAPNTPAALIQKYLFEDQAKNLLNLTKGQPAVHYAAPAEKEVNDRTKNHR